MPTRLLQLNRQTVRLDARADRLDPRDRPYAPPLSALPPRWPQDARLRRLLPAYVDQGLVLDQGSQGNQGACTGYGLAAVVNFLLWQRDGLERSADGGSADVGSAAVGSAAGGSASDGSDGSDCTGRSPGSTGSDGDNRSTGNNGITGSDGSSGSDVSKRSSTGSRAESVSAQMLYDLARFYDEWPGEEYEGSSCRGAIKGWSKHGSCLAPLWQASVHADQADQADRANAIGYRPDPRWASDAATRPLGVYYRVDSNAVTDMQAALHAIGALYVSASVHAGWLVLPASRALSTGHAALPVIAWDGMPDDAGNHAFAIVGYNEYGFVVQNSWGEDWGAHGFAVLTYDDWRDNGLDCWVAALGVPQVAAAATTVTPVVDPSGATLAASKSRRVGTSLAAADPPVLANPALAGALPWSTDIAYAHTLVSGNNGVLRSSRPDIGRAADLVDVALHEHLGAWLNSSDNNSSSSGKKVVIYAHGGLNSEASSLRRIRVMGPYFLANGIYPLFYTWRTGLLETVGDVLQDAVGDTPAPAQLGRTFSDAKDGLLEIVAHQVQWMWREMKDNAALAAQGDGALALLAAALVRLRQDHPTLEIHLAGHSAGAFVHGHLLELCRAATLPVASVTLYAPACSLAFARSCFVAAVDAGVVPRGHFWLHVLSDVAERNDTVGPYGKSLLYLVARGFEEVRKTPLAGLQRTLDAVAVQPDDDLWRTADWPTVQAWRAWVAALPAQADGAPACEVTGMQMPVSLQRAVQPGHSAFDNDIVILTRTINRILGQAPGATLPAPVTNLDY